MSGWRHIRTSRFSDQPGKIHLVGFFSGGSVSSTTLLFFSPQWSSRSSPSSSTPLSSTSWSSRATITTPGRTASAGVPPSSASAVPSSSAACRATRTSWPAWPRPNTSTPRPKGRTWTHAPSWRFLSHTSQICGKVQLPSSSTNWFWSGKETPCLLMHNPLFWSVTLLFKGILPPKCT